MGMSQEGKEVKCGYCKKTRTRKCKKTVLDQIQTLKDPESIKKAEAMLCQKKEIIWTSYEFLGSCFKESKESYGMAVQAQPDDYKMWVPIQKSEVFSDGIQESVESDERPDKDSGKTKMTLLKVKQIKMALLKKMKMALLKHIFDTHLKLNIIDLNYIPNALYS